jgi:hypothetical protein
MLYLQAVSVVSSNRGFVCRSAAFLSCSVFPLRKFSRSSADKEKKAASVAEARDVKKISMAARMTYRTPGSSEIKRSV